MKKMLQVIVLWMVLQPLLTGCKAPLSPDAKQSTSKSFADNSDTRIVRIDTAYGNPNFVTAAREVTAAVVHIKTKVEEQTSAFSDPLSRLYGRRGGPVMLGSGSGVTISSDGYIATNNHVVENASDIEVIFPDRRSFKAKLVGADPTTDLALLKVDASELPVVSIGNSDDVQVGEWVLAVGYPLSLNTTVTAGIISAKGRSIGIINRTLERGYSRSGVQANTAIESFLQTDAAINPGNSGGALVNTSGQLIGINTAIASQTGSYAGYAFAIPVNLAVKVLDDIRQFGTVKRGILGVSFPPPALEDQYLKQQGIDPGSVKGVYIINVLKGSAADEAGLRAGDFIEQINGIPIASSSDLSEQIARHHPGDQIELTYLRNGKENTTKATLQGAETASRDQSLSEIYDKLGAAFSPVPDDLKKRLEIRSGVLVTEVKSGGFFDRIGVPAGTIIVVINGRPVNTPQDVEKSLMSAQRGVIRMLAIAPDGSRVAFSFSLGT